MHLVLSSSSSSTSSARRNERSASLHCVVPYQQANLNVVASQAWYGRMAEHYRNGGLPPWETGVGDGSVKSPLVSPTQSAYPTPQYENPSQVSVYGNLPMTAYENPMCVTGYTTTSHHTTKSVPPTPVTQSLSPQPQHSQYSGTPFEPYNAPTNVGHSVLSPPFTGTPAQFSPTSSPPQEIGRAHV